MKTSGVTHNQSTLMSEQRKKLGRFSVNKSDIVLLILSLFVPPICVWKRKGFFTRDFLLNLLLFLMFYIPAIIHADYVIYETSKERNTDYEFLSNGPQEAELPNNGDYNVDLEANSGDLPQYDEIVGSSNGNGAENLESNAIAAANAMDNKVQH